jgi:hypothetical protein
MRKDLHRTPLIVTFPANWRARLSDFSTNPYTYISGTAALTSIFSTAAMGATHDRVNRSIALARLAKAKHARLQATRRWHEGRRKLELDLAIAQCDAAIARWHLKKLEQARTQQS